MQTYNAGERITLAVLLTLLGMPMLVLGGLVLLRQPHPLIALSAVTITAAVFAILWPRTLINQPHPYLSSLPLSIAFTVYAAVAIIISTAYLALPDVDPYHWLKVYQQMITAPDHLLPQRPLFAALYFIFDTILPWQPITIAKYVMPLLALLPLLPLWLVARRLHAAAYHWALLFTPLATPALIVHMNMAAPQAVLLILTFFFASFLMYAFVTRQMRWHYIAGATAALSIFYHGLATLLLAVWLTATALRSRYYPFLLAFLIVIGVLSLPYLSAYFPAATRALRPNPSFPSSFTTIDGVPNGWPGLWGWTRYYAFYAGFTAPVIFAASFIAAARGPSALAALRSLASHPSTLALILCLVSFLSIAELLPRLLNIVVLPERAWLFVAIIAPVLLLPLLPPPRHKMIISACLFAAVALNVSGAIYINQLKSYRLPDHTIRAARWLANHAPAHAIVLTTLGPDYLDRYAPVRFTALNHQFYCEHRHDTADDLRTALKELMPAPSEQSFYVFFARRDLRHPYASRPWHEPIDTTCDLPLLSQFPASFTELYNEADNAIIWQVK